MRPATKLFLLGAVLAIAAIVWQQRHDQTEKRPGQVAVTGPEWTYDTQPRWHWNPVADAVQYRVVLNDVQQELTSSLEFQPAQPLEPGIHQVRVTALSSTGQNPGSGGQPTP